MTETQLPVTSPVTPGASIPTTGPAQPAPLTRPRNNRMIGGVCAGIAARYGWSPRKVRVLAVLSCLLPGPQFLGYVLLWLVIPEGDS